MTLFYITINAMKEANRKLLISKAAKINIPHVQLSSTVYSKWIHKIKSSGKKRILYVVFFNSYPFKICFVIQVERHSKPGKLLR